MKNVFAPVIGYEDVKLELMQVLDQLVNPEKYKALGVDVPHGLLLDGDPGVGKSTIARCFAEGSGRKVFVCRKDKPNGEFVKEIVRVFQEAAAAAPSVVLLDDLDKFSNADENRRDAEEFVTVQSCIDKVKDQQVFVVATVNGLRKLPKSLIRAGRFDYILTVNIPSGKDAAAIVKHYLAEKAYTADLDHCKIARLLDGYSCAMLERVINQAGVYAAFADRAQILMEDIIKAVLRIIFNAPEISRADEKTLPLIACHEAGHALVAELLEPESVNLVSVLSHDSSTCGVTSLHRADDYFLSKEKMEIRVMTLLAGKAATELCYGTVDTGANSDLQRSFAIVYRFVDDYCSYGFDGFVFARENSNEVMDRRDAKVGQEVAHFYEKAKKILQENRDKLDALTAVLVKEKTLLGDKVQEVIRCA